MIVIKGEVRSIRVLLAGTLDC